MELIDRFFNPPDASFCLFCPRGMGNFTFITLCFSKLWLPLNSHIVEMKFYGIRSKEDRTLRR